MGRRDVRTLQHPAHAVQAGAGQQQSGRGIGRKRLQQGKQLLDLSHLHTFGFGLAKPAKNPKGFFVLFGVCYVLSKKKDAIFGRYYFKKGENYPL